MTDFRQLPDLAARSFGGAVIAADDEFFAAKENLVRDTPPAARDDFGHKGKEYDGWETRRRRAPGHDRAIVRLGAAGIVAGVVVDTAFFTGNYPPRASVEAARALGGRGAAGLAPGAVVDRAFFPGTSPPRAWVEAAAVEGHPSVAELEKADWQPLLPLSELAGGTTNAFPVDSDRRVTHVR